MPIDLLRMLNQCWQPKATTGSVHVACDMAWFFSSLNKLLVHTLKSKYL